VLRYRVDCVSQQANRHFLQHSYTVPVALANDQATAAWAKPVPAYFLLPHIDEEPSDGPGITRPNELPQVLQEPGHTMGAVAMWPWLTFFDEAVANEKAP